MGGSWVDGNMGEKGEASGRKTGAFMREEKGVGKETDVSSV